MMNVDDDINNLKKKNHRLFDGDESVALIANKAAGATHTDNELEDPSITKSSSTEEIKWVFLWGGEDGVAGTLYFFFGYT